MIRSSIIHASITKVIGYNYVIQCFSINIGCFNGLFGSKKGQIRSFHVISHMPTLCNGSYFKELVCYLFGGFFYLLATFLIKFIFLKISVSHYSFWNVTSRSGNYAVNVIVHLYLIFQVICQHK